MKRRAIITLHIPPSEAGLLPVRELIMLLNEYVEIKNEEQGKGKPKVYEYERDALNKLKEEFEKNNKGK